MLHEPIDTNKANKKVQLKMVIPQILEATTIYARGGGEQRKSGEGEDMKSLGGHRIFLSK